MNLYLCFDIFKILSDILLNTINETFYHHKIAQESLNFDLKLNAHVLKASNSSTGMPDFDDVTWIARSKNRRKIKKQKFIM